jgi:hypothetical protein
MLFRLQSFLRLKIALILYSGVFINSTPLPQGLLRYRQRPAGA